MKLCKGKGAYSTLTDINITVESVKVKQRNSQGQSLRVLISSPREPRIKPRKASVSFLAHLQAEVGRSSHGLE